MLQMGQEVQVRIANVNTDNNTVNLSMVPAGAFGGGGGGGYGERSDLPRPSFEIPSQMYSSGLSLAHIWPNDRRTRTSIEVCTGAV